jgi:hypothetical protein
MKVSLCIKSFRGPSDTSVLTNYGAQDSEMCVWRACKKTFHFMIVDLFGTRALHPSNTSLRYMTWYFQISHTYIISFLVDTPLGQLSWMPLCKRRPRSMRAARYLNCFLDWPASVTWYKDSWWAMTYQKTLVFTKNFNLPRICLKIWHLFEGVDRFY